MVDTVAAAPAGESPHQLEGTGSPVARAPSASEGSPVAHAPSASSIVMLKYMCINNV